MTVEKILEKLVSFPVLGGESNMTIQELGSIGEFISSIVVLITLIYLAVQVRQTRNATIASTMQTNRMQFQSIMLANRDSQIAPIIIKADNHEPLTDEE